MQIGKMRNEHFSEISEVDYLVFNRSVPRTIENFEALKSFDPDGCFVLEVDSKAVAYIFSKTYGTEGFLGPVGVHPQYQGKGIGKSLLDKSIDYLKTKCAVIGLEVAPEKVRNIEIYHKLGFVPSLPSYVFDINLSGLAAGSGNFKTDSYSMNDSKRVFEIIDGLKDLNYSCHKDIKAVLSTGGDISIVSNDEEPCGFLAYSKTCLAYIWGAFIENRNRQEAVRAGLASVCSGKKDERCQIIVNSRYRNAVEVLLNLDCKVSRCMNRMLLKGFEGDYLSESDKLIFRPWMG